MNDVLLCYILGGLIWALAGIREHSRHNFKYSDSSDAYFIVISSVLWPFFLMILILCKIYRLGQFDKIGKMLIKPIEFEGIRLKRKEKFAPITVPGYAMATKAHHLSSDVSREQGSLCYIQFDLGSHYSGKWVYGCATTGIRFPKTHTRGLTKEEILHWQDKGVILDAELGG